MCNERKMQVTLLMFLRFSRFAERSSEIHAGSGRRFCVRSKLVPSLRSDCEVTGKHVLPAGSNAPVGQHEAPFAF